MVIAAFDDVLLPAIKNPDAPEDPEPTLDPGHTLTDYFVLFCFFLALRLACCYYMLHFYMFKQGNEDACNVIT